MNQPVGQNIVSSLEYHAKLIAKALLLVSKLVGVLKYCFEKLLFVSTIMHYPIGNSQSLSCLPVNSILTLRPPAAAS